LGQIINVHFAITLLVLGFWVWSLEVDPMRWAQNGVV
jgi:hypothetical protein